MSRKRLVSRTDASTLREQAHRRATMVGLCTILLLGTSPVIGHHLLPVDTSDLLAGVDHLGALCLTALHLLFAPVYPAVHIALGCGVLYAAWDRCRALRLVRSSLALLEVKHAREGDPFWCAAEAVAVDPGLLRVVRGLTNPAFTAGMFQPRIYVAAALATRLPPAELAAVIAHEGAHVARRDPLRLTLLRALACTLFWLPALRRLADDVGDQAELIADDAAAARARPLVLASAILSVAHWSSESARTSGAVGFNRAELLDRRIRRLAGEETVVRSHLTPRSLLGAMAALLVVWTSSVLLTHPLPAHASDEHARHCDHQGEAAWAHLFCLGAPFGATPADCPHRHG